MMKKYDGITNTAHFAQHPVLERIPGIRAAHFDWPTVAATLQALGGHAIRYGLVVVLLWIGAMKFTAYEANGIEPLVAHSPLLSWMYDFVSVRVFAFGLGIVEISIAALIAFRPWSAPASAIGSALAIPMFLTTLSFLFSTPGWEPSLGGFPALSASVGQFLLKDAVLLGAAIWSAGEAWSAALAKSRSGSTSNLS